MPQERLENLPNQRQYPTGQKKSFREMVVMTSKNFLVEQPFIFKKSCQLSKILMTSLYLIKKGNDTSFFDKFYANDYSHTRK